MPILSRRQGACALPLPPSPSERSLICCMPPPSSPSSEGFMPRSSCSPSCHSLTVRASAPSAAASFVETYGCQMNVADSETLQARCRRT